MKPTDFEKIALWLGWRKGNSAFGDACWWDTEFKYRGRIDTKTSLTDAEAVEAIRTAQAKGYCLRADFLSNGEVAIDLWIGAEKVETGYHPSFSAAVEAALLALIEREG